MTIPLLHARFGVYPSRREMPISRLNRCGDLWLIPMPLGLRAAPFRQRLLTNPRDWQCII